jgi:hypothetical protein
MDRGTCTRRYSAGRATWSCRISCASAASPAGSAVCGAAGVPMSTHLYPEVAAHVMRVTETAHWLDWQDWANPILQRPYDVKAGRIQFQICPASGWSGTRRPLRPTSLISDRLRPQRAPPAQAAKVMQAPWPVGARPISAFRRLGCGAPRNGRITIVNGSRTADRRSVGQCSCGLPLGSAPAASRSPRIL